MAKKALSSGRAFEKFKEMVQAQGGDIRYVEHPEFFERDAFEGEVFAAEDGFLSGMDTEKIGVAAGLLGAGRETKDSVIDMSAGHLPEKENWRYREKRRSDCHLLCRNERKIEQWNGNV